MDPVSVVALASNALQVTEFAGQVLVRLYRYYLDVKTATLRAAELREEVGFAFSQLNAITAELKYESFTLIPVEQSRLQAALTRFREILEIIDKRVQPEAIRGMQRLKWPFQKEHTSRLITEIERCKSNFSLALNIKQRYVTCSLPT